MIIDSYVVCQCLWSDSGPFNQLGDCPGMIEHLDNSENLNSMTQSYQWMLHTVSKHFTSALVHSFNCCLFSCWMVRFFYPQDIFIFMSYSHSHSHLFQPIAPHHLLCTSSIVVPILMFMSDGPLFCPLDLFLFPSILFHHISISSPPSIVAPTSCRMVHFFVPKVYLYPIPIPSPSHHLLFTTSIVAPFSC